MGKNKLIGSILLIVGTSIGGGMLALPVSTAEAGFVNSLFFLFLCWLVMTIGALLILEVNLRLPAGSNMISMAESTLGLPGKLIAWLSYLVLLYSLLAAYIAGGSDILLAFIQQLHIQIPPYIGALLFTALFGLVVYQGIRAVDYVNRGLMFGKLSVYLLLIILISPHVEFHALQEGSLRTVSSSIMILISSFGFASIVPSLRDYLQSDVKLLRKAIIYGSLIPLLCYIVWDGAIMGVVTRQGDMGLIALNHSGHATSGLTEALSSAINNPWIGGFFGFFSSICMVTAFLGVSIGLFDFLADGLRLKKTGVQGKSTWILTFIPPLAIAMFYPGAYLTALSYAGICCVILLLLMPALMSWRARLTDSDNTLILVPGGYVMLSIIIVVASYLLTIAR